MVSSDSGKNSPVASSVLPAVIKPFERRVSTASAMEYRRLPFLRVASRSVADISAASSRLRALRPASARFYVCQSLIPPSACAAGWRGNAQFGAGGIIYRTTLTMPRVTCRAGNINQSFSQGGTHRLCLQENKPPCGVVIGKWRIPKSSGPFRPANSSTRITLYAGRLDVRGTRRMKVPWLQGNVDMVGCIMTRCPGFRVLGRISHLPMPIYRWFRFGKP